MDDYSTISMVDRSLAKKCRDELLLSRTADGSSGSLASGSDWLENDGTLDDDTVMAKIVDHIGRHWDVLDDYTFVVDKTDAVATGWGSTQHTYVVSVFPFRPDRGNLTCGPGDGRVEAWNFSLISAKNVQFVRKQNQTRMTFRDTLERVQMLNCRV